MLRSVLGVMVSAVAWMIGFFVLARLFFFVWPAYAVPARAWTAGAGFHFTPGMAICTALFWLLADLGAGWLAMKISRRRHAVWALAGLLAAYLCLMHLLLYWHDFPWWYNLSVALPALPAVLLGGRLAASGDSWRR